MSQTKAGAAKARATLLAKDPNYYRNIGKLGGSVLGVKKGFAIDNRTWFDKLLQKPSRAKLAGIRGGTASRRVKKV